MTQPTRTRLLGALLALTLVLSGCFGREAAPEPTPEPVELRFVSLNQSPAERLLTEAYSEVNPHVQIEMEGYSQMPAGYLNSGDQMPDLMYITPGYFLNSAAETGELTDLSDLWEQTGLVDLYPPSVTRLSDFDGKQYFLPVGYQWSGIYYNTAVFDQYGIEPPTTWDELMGAADTLVAAGVTPFALAGNDTWLTSLWFSYLNYRLNGPEFHQELMAGRVPYTDSRVQDVFQLWHWMFENGYFSKNAGAIDTLSALMSTIRGDGGQIERNKTAMILASPSFMDDLPAKFRGELDFVPFPTIDPSLPVGEVVVASGYMVPSGAPHRDEVLDFLAFVASEESLDALAEQALLEETVPAIGIDGLKSVPDPLRRGSAIVENADLVDVAYIFGVPFEMQAAFEGALNSMLRQVDDNGSFEVQEIVERLEAANQ